MAATIYYINCLTNLHVGSGDVNFNTVDNEVERDPVTGYPTIHASGVKGALRQFFVENGSAHTIKLFGSSVQKSKTNPRTPGSLKILTAQMLGRPARTSQGSAAYYMVTTKLALEQLCNIGGELGCAFPFSPSNLSPTADYHSTPVPVAVEGHSVNTALSGELTMREYLSSRLGEQDFLVLSDETFRKLPLPVIARNQLENGESKNLWYEEYVPHKSVFWFAVTGSKEDLEAFDRVVNGKLIQFGGNASIGCGLCIVTKGESTDV